MHRRFFLLFFISLKSKGEEGCIFRDFKTIKMRVCEVCEKIMTRVLLFLNNVKHSNKIFIVMLI